MKKLVYLLGALALVAGCESKKDAAKPEQSAPADTHSAPAEDGAEAPPPGSAAPAGAERAKEDASDEEEGDGEGGKVGGPAMGSGGGGKTEMKQGTRKTRSPRKNRKGGGRDGYSLEEEDDEPSAVPKE